MPKKKKPMWPIYATILIVVCAIAVLLIDWERYPTAKEMENYLQAQHVDVEKVEVVEMSENEDAYDAAMIYKLKYTYESGRVENHSYTIKKRDRKPVFPWHDYYAEQYPKDADK